MNNITFYTHLKAQFHKKFHITNDTENIFFYNDSSVGLLGKIDNVRFIVSLPMKGKIIEWECSYKNEPMKNGVFNVTIVPVDEQGWFSNLKHKFVLSLTTSLNNLSIDTLIEGFNLAFNYYKSVSASTNQFINTVDNNEEGYQDFKSAHVSMTKDEYHQNEISLYDLKIMFEALGHYHVHNGEEHIPAYIDDYGTMILDAVLAHPNSSKKSLKETTK